LAQGTLYTHSVTSSLSCLSFGCTSTPFRVVWFHCHRYTVLSHYSCNGLGDVFYIKNHDRWPFYRITLLSGLLVSLRLNLAPNFVESPLGIPTCTKGRFYMGIFLFPKFPSSLTEHKKSALTDHATQENHVINWTQATVIDKEPERFTRWIKEAVHIRKEGQQVINYQLSVSSKGLMDFTTCHTTAG